MADTNTRGNEMTKQRQLIDTIKRTMGRKPMTMAAILATAKPCYREDYRRCMVRHIELGVFRRYWTPAGEPVYFVAR